jgi:IclR family acetate operon transcriptional repressor
MAVKPLTSAQATLLALEEIARSQPVGVSALARTLGVTKSSAQRMLATLAEAGWIAQASSARARWELTSRAWTVGRAFLDRYDIRHTLLPLMTALRDSTGETVNLSVRDADRSVIVEAVESLQPVRASSRIGASSPLLLSASGRALLAAANPSELDELVRTHPELAPSRDELATDRQRGYSLSMGAVNPEVNAVAVPVRNSAGSPVGAVVVSGPRERMPRALAESHGVLLVDRTAGIAVDTAGTAR